MIGGITHLVSSGPLLLAMPVAAAAGAVTFLSPCCLPLVPGYLSYLTGMSGTSVADQAPAAASAGATGTAERGTRAAAAGASPASATSTLTISGPLAGEADGEAYGGPTRFTARRQAGLVRGRAVFGTLLFVLGFSAVFVAEAAALGSVGGSLVQHAKILSQVLGCLIIVLGLLFVGAFDRFSLSGRIFRPTFRPRAGLAGAPLLGVVFGLGWTPCIGPTLGAVLTLGLTTGDAGRAGLLAFVYALGLGVPFLIVAFAFQRGINVFAFARRHARLVTQIGGLMLITVGLLEVTGAWYTAVIWLQTHWVSGYTPSL